MGQLTDDLKAQLLWDSSTGERADLAGVTIFEELKPGAGWVSSANPICVGCLDAPPPFVFRNHPNDWVSNLGAGKTWTGDGREWWDAIFPPHPQSGAGKDHHGTYDLLKPYVNGSFVFEQRYMWTAPWMPVPQGLLTDRIHRQILVAGPTILYFVTSDYAGTVVSVIDVPVLRALDLHTTPSGKTATLQFGGSLGETYEVQRAATVAGPWETIQTISFPNPGPIGFEIVDTNPPPSAAYYRLRQR